MPSRFRDALERWLDREPVGVEALVTEPPDVCRRASTAAAILETVAWLEAHGWAGTDRGWLQCYALWLLACRDAYEGDGALA